MTLLSALAREVQRHDRGCENYKTGFFYNEITRNFIFIIGCSNFVVRTYGFLHNCVMHLDRLYGSVCVSLNEVVLGRYTFVFLNYFTSMVVIIILYLGFVLCRKATFDVPDIMLGLGLSFLVFSTITGIQMPLFFKMGYTKAKLWSVIPFAVVMLLVVLPSFVSALSGILDFAQSHKELFAFACILTSCIIQFVSYHIAVIFYRKQR